MEMVEISGSSVTAVQVVARAATVGRFPHAAADRRGIGYDTAIGGRRRIDGNGVNSPFSYRVIKTSRTVGHAQRLRTEGGKNRRNQRVWVGEIKLQMLSRWDASCHTLMLCDCRAHPGRVKPASGKG